ncbi:MAG TPA: universal stress protein UspA [Cryomorphaceae bacterium]|nr:universal stress protein UspA [Owenweeksia sp.]HBF20633.1 universal stress protein UspA [Cryomorphaceae bacterium]|tara:strand:+ start:14134 stop:15000 length:867 start_codon:yes stop_codon:yes gene_type:complete
MIEKPFGNIATAIAFSPNMEANIAESVRIKQSLGERLILIHIGDRTPEEEQLLSEVLGRQQVNQEEIVLVWEEGDPVTAILKACTEHKVDLLIAGALPREGLLKYYIGSVARRLVRKSDCSILLMTHPNQFKSSCRRIVVNGLDHPKTPITIETAIKVGVHFRSSEIVIVEEVVPARVGKRVEDDKSLEEVNQAKKSIQEKENQRINTILQGIDIPSDIKVSEKCIFGKRGYTIGHFTQQFNADLLVMNSPDTKLGFLDRVFTHDLEYILSELPSDLLIVHSSERPHS